MFRPTNRLVLATDGRSAYHVHVRAICINTDCLRVTTSAGPRTALTVHPEGTPAILDLHDRVEHVKSMLNKDLTKETSERFPDPYDLFYLGRSPTVTGAELFNDFEKVHQRDGTTGLHDRVRTILGLDAKGVLHFPSPIGDVIVTDAFIRHVPEMRRNGNGVDEDHMRYVGLTPQTIMDPDEALFGVLEDDGRRGDRPRQRKFYTLLKTYIVDDGKDGQFMLFHRVLIFDDRHLRTSHRLDGEARAFHGKRRGTLIHAAYLGVI